MAVSKRTRFEVLKRDNHTCRYCGAAVLVERMGERDERSVGCSAGRDTIGRWFNMAVPIELVTDAARIASNSNLRFSRDGRFRYMCGVIYNQITVIDEAVELHRALAGTFAPEEWLTEVRIAAYEFGYRQAERNAILNDPLSLVVDNLERSPA